MEGNNALDIYNEIVPYLPLNIGKGLKRLDRSILYGAKEIRLRADRPAMLHFGMKDGFLKENGSISSSPQGALIVTSEDLAESVYKICENSWYAYQEDINKGFITIKGGHRVGLIGTPVLENGKIINIRDISSVNIRIAREIKGCAESVIRYLVRNKYDIYNTLIISPPGLGKTTILRDIIRLLSNGFMPEFYGLKVGVIDERGEIAASYKGIPANDLGFRTDIINSIHKSLGMEILLRSMSPDIIALDELGNPEDVATILQVLNAGIRLVATAHGYDSGSLKIRQGFKEIFNVNAFERFMILSVDKAMKYHTTILDGDENVIAMVSEISRKPVNYGEHDNGRICLFSQVNGKDREYTANTGIFNGAGK
jgi:stage III sporulation protein AA